jgi:hypothetical protein
MSASDTYRQFYDAVYSQDHPSVDSHGWIQWKGTDVCMDIKCRCGHAGHVDTDFFYYYRCPSCGTVFAIGQVVKLIPLTDDQAKYVESTSGASISSDTDAA